MLLKGTAILASDLISSTLISYLVNASTFPRLPTLYDSLEGPKGLSIQLYLVLRFTTETQ